jgi:Spy/CpxP family protein refolding chaperone
MIATKVLLGQGEVDNDFDKLRKEVEETQIKRREERLKLRNQRYRLLTSNPKEIRVQMAPTPKQAVPESGSRYRTVEKPPKWREGES